ncbi:MAG: hypothetical protein D6755_11075 [Anaerolineae bacterium]|nr:MAG: hypothetical protein D6755_11075 [Anaerolineae bacterium]
MISLNIVFWLFVIVFAAIGAMRGWAKELLVAFSVILALFIIAVLDTYIQPMQPFLNGNNSTSFWTQSIIVIVLAFFGYQTPNMPRVGGGKFAKDKLQDALFGAVLGAFNGYLIIGSLWFFLDQAKYFPDFISAPIPGTPAGDAAIRLLSALPPVWLTIPTVYFAIAVSFLFVVVVFI